MASDSLSYTVDIKCLCQALGPTSDGNPLPHLMMNGHHMKITFFFDDAAGMRVTSIPLTSPSTCPSVCFEITPTMHGFITRCRRFDQMTFKINRGALSLLVKSTYSALRYDFPNIKMVPDVSIDHTREDTVLQIPSADWLEIWKTIPNDEDDARVTIAYGRNESAVTLAHSNRAWAAVIQPSQCPVAPPSLSFTCPVSAAKYSFSDCLSNDSQSSLHFLSNTVLCWTSSNVSVYLAPFIANVK
jgi:hypothetical protein